MGRQFKRNKGNAKRCAINAMTNRRKLVKKNKKKVNKFLVDRAKQFIRNLSDYKLSDHEIVALGKGLNFIPNPAKPNKGVLMESADILRRSMRIRYLAAIKGWESRHKFRNPSTWSPGETPSTALEDYLEGTKTELAKVPVKDVQHNISKAEVQAINKLKRNQDIVLKKFDKGRGICIMSRKDYIEEGLRQLNDRKAYLRLEYDMTTHTATMVTELISDMFDANQIDKALADYLDPSTSYETKTPVFFMLPKVHKKVKEPGQVFVGRPVVSSCGAPLNRIAEFLDFYLLPEVKKSPAYWKDTADTIRKIEGLVLPDNIIIASIDVVSMFTAVPQEEAYDVAMSTLAKINPTSYDPPMPSLAYMRKILKLVLYRNAFEFNEKFYLQIAGCPMGLKSSPSLCCLVVNKLVHRIMSMDENIISFHIYMDDSLLTWKGSMKELEEFIMKINELHPSLNFTFTASRDEIQFLDLVIYKGMRFRTMNILDVRCFTKPTETWCYLDRNSCHSPAVFRGFIKGELIRYARNSNNLDSYEEKKSIFTQKLLSRGYNREEINKAAEEVDFGNRQHFIADKYKSDEIPLVFKIQYYPHMKSRHIKNALLKHWNIISDQPDLKRIFPKEPIIAYSRPKNLSDKLVRARLPDGNDDELYQVKDTRPGSPTLHMLEDLAMENRGLDEFFTSHEGSSSYGDALFDFEEVDLESTDTETE